MPFFPFPPPADTSPRLLWSGAYTGLFRMPTPGVVAEGDLMFGFAGGKRAEELELLGRIPNASIYSAVVGFLPGLEVGASFLTPSPFNGIIDDRSVAFKYAFLNEPRAPFSLAFGSTDASGTRRRATDYVVAGKRLGNLNVYGGHGRGFMPGAMAGATWDVANGVQLAAERAGGLTMAGIRARITPRLSAAVGMDNGRRSFVGASFSLPLGTRTPDEEPEILQRGTPELAKRLAALGRGQAEAEIHGDTLVARYEDVEARDPVATLGQALRFMMQAAGREQRQVQVTVRRFGKDLVTLSGAVVDIRAYMNGYREDNAFREQIVLREGAIDGPSPDAEKSGRAPAATVAVRPGINYRLGIRDVLPNREWIEAKVVAPLPLGLIAAGSVELNVNNSLDDQPVVPSPSFGVYRVDRPLSGTWTALGIDRTPLDGTAAVARVAHFSPRSPLRLQGEVGVPLGIASEGNDTRYAVEAGGDFLKGALSLWARYERFQGGDAGETFGATRRFGQTWVSIFSTHTRDEDDGPLRKVGIDFQIPLPGARTRLGPVHVTTAPTADFRYQPTVHATASLGRGIRRNPLFTPEAELTARGQLTVLYIRQHVAGLRAR